MKKAGQTFYEGPTDVHLVDRNASSTEPVRRGSAEGEGRSDSHPGKGVMDATELPKQ